MLGIAALNKLASSGLTDKHGATLKMEELSAEDVRALPGASPNWPSLTALKIPYFKPTGRVSEFYRLRFLEDPRTGFEKAAEVKALRYVQPADEVTEVYLPPLLPDRSCWADVFKDTSIPINITEGELKAAAAMAAGLYPTIGLGGASNFRSAKLGVGLLPMLDAVSWSSREVYIIFDSDAATNPMVEVAQYKLARELLKKGAAVRIASLPHAQENRKQGLDDYLLNNNSEVFYNQVLLNSRGLAECESLHSFNDVFAFVTNPGIIVNMATGQEMGPDKFVKAVAGNHTHWAQDIKITSKGEKRITLKEKKTAKEWVEWYGRREVDRIVYSPGEPQITPAREYNTWTGWKSRPVKGDVSPWKTLLGYIINEEEDWWRTWVEQWYACPIQQPGVKMYTSLVLYSPEKGTGKSLLGTSMRYIYGDNWGVIGEQALTQSFNSWAANKQFIMGEEISSGESRKSTVAEVLKHMITTPFIDINKKYVPEYRIRACINFQFNTNHPDALYLEDGDRRYGINRTRAKPMDRAFYRDVYMPWIQSEAGANALHYHLLNLDLTGFDPQGPAPDTQAKLDMKLALRGPVYDWFKRLHTAPDTVIGPYGKDLVTADTVQLLYLQGTNTQIKINTVRAELARHNFPVVAGGRQIYTEKGTRQTVYIVRNHDRWLNCRPAEATAHLEGREAPYRAAKANFDLLAEGRTYDV